MSNQSSVYDLGVVDTAVLEQAPVVERSTAVDQARASRPRAIQRTQVPERRLLDTIADSLELFCPGVGQLCRARWSDGLFALSVIGFLLSLGWATWETLDRLPATLAALSLPPHAGVYALAAIYACVASLHTANVLYGTSRCSARAHPVSAGCASLLVPGWGQLLNRQPAKASAFVAGLWSVGFAWLLASPWIEALFQTQGVALRGGLEVLSSPVLLWTATAVLWALSVYDAVASARR